MNHLLAFPESISAGCRDRVVQWTQRHRCVCRGFCQVRLFALNIILFCSSYCVLRNSRNNLFAWGLSCFLWTSSQLTSHGSDQHVGSSFVDTMAEVKWASTGQNLTFIGYQVNISNNSLSQQLKFCCRNTITSFDLCYRIHPAVEMFTQVQQHMKLNND